MKFSDLKKYQYQLPADLIRTAGVEPRDSARLFVYDTRTDVVSFDIFRNIGQYIPKKSLVALNDTRVIPARLWLKKETGGKIEVFVLANQIEHEKPIPVLVDRKVSIGQKLLFSDGSSFEVLDQAENIFYVQLVSNRNLFELMDQYGETPLPHYLEGAGTPELELRQRYQSIFAHEGASVAAPTASLHFTEQVLSSFEERSIETVRVSLNVGLGTFASLKEENFITGRLHSEYASVSVETATKLNEAKISHRPVVAVGTTVARTLESFGQMGQIRPGSGKTNIFIFPPYQFHMVDVLVTNFHLPQTSLMLLVDAFLQQKGAKRNILALYDMAIREKFSFYSFGDSMLIL